MSNNLFGYSLAVNSDATIIVVGSPNDTVGLPDDTKYGAGCIEIFSLDKQINEYTSRYKLTNENYSQYNYFGSEIIIKSSSDRNLDISVVDKCGIEYTIQIGKVDNDLKIITDCVELI